MLVYHFLINKIKHTKIQIIKFVFVNLFFLILTYLASYKVLPYYGSITYGDGSYFFNLDNFWTDVVTTFSPNYLGQDQSNILFIYVPKAISIFLLKFLGLTDNVISYLLFFGLFFVSSLTYYLICNNISKNIYYGLLAGSIVVLNNLSIEYIIFGGGYFYFLGIISFGILLYLLWQVYQRKKISYKYCTLIILNSLLIVHPFYFIIYLIQLLLFFIVHFFFEYISFKKNIFKYIVTILGIITIHSYWLLSFIFGSLNRSPESTYSGNLDAVFNGFVSISSYINAINFFHYFGFISRNFHQTFWHYLFYIGIIAILIMSILFINKSNNKRFLMFILFSYLIFFNLALGPKSTLFGDIWFYLWNNISFFNFFRTYPRFLTIIFPLILIYFAILNIDWRVKYKNNIYALILIVVLLLNISAFTGDYKGNILATNIPNEYPNLNNYIENDNHINNIISFPNTPYESYKWGINNNTTFIQQNYYLKDYLFIKPIIYDRISLSLTKKNILFNDVFRSTKVEYFDDNFKKMNIGYVLIQKDLINILSLKSTNYQTYDDYFNYNSNYQLIEYNKYYNLYKFNNRSYILNSNNIHFKKENPTKYRIFIENVSNNLSLSFLQNYNSNWKLYLKSKPTSSFCIPINDNNVENEGGIIECLLKNMFFNVGDLIYLYEKPVFEDTHKLINTYANGWTINTEFVIENYTPQYYELNSDGSINIELVLYFKPQSYFYLGSIISISTLLFCFIYLIIIFNKNRRYA